jgi:hypothetical protein
MMLNSLLFRIRGRTLLCRQKTSRRDIGEPEFETLKMAFVNAAELRQALLWMFPSY